MPWDNHLFYELYELVYDALYVHTDIEGAGFIHISNSYVSTATLTAGSCPRREDTRHGDGGMLSFFIPAS